jgi:hypothetical protein
MSLICDGYERLTRVETDLDARPELSTIADNVNVEDQSHSSPLATAPTESFTDSILTPSFRLLSSFDFAYSPWSLVVRLFSS